METKEMLIGIINNINQTYIPIIGNDKSTVTRMILLKLGFDSFFNNTQKLTKSTN